MVRKQIFQGAVLLAASAAAALAACSSEDAGVDDAGGGGADGGDDGASTGGTSSSGGAAATGGAGGEGGGGGEGGAPTHDPVTAQEFVDAYCPAATSAYAITEGDEAANPYSEISYSVPTAYVTWGEDDSVSVDADNTAGTSTSPFCVVGGEGDDYVRVSGSSGGTDAASFDGSAVSMTFFGGEGADELYYQVYVPLSDIWSKRWRPTFHFVDFESGVDVITVYAQNVLVNATLGTDGVVVIENFDATSSAEYSGANDFALVVDPIDNEIWLSTYSEGQINVLIGVVDGDPLEPGDVVVIPPPPPPN